MPPSGSGRGQTVDSQGTYRVAFYRDVVENAERIYKEALEEEELGQPRPKKPRISDISSDDLVVPKAKELTDNWGENESRLAKSKKPEVKQKSTQLKHVVFFAIDEAQSLTKPVTSGNDQITPFYYVRQILRACRDLPLFSVLLSTRTTSNIDQFVPPKENDASARLQHRYLQLIPPFCALGWDHGALSFSDPPTLSAVASLEYKASLGRPLFASRYRAGLDLPDEEERSEFLKDIVNFTAQKLIRNEARPAQLNNDQLLACLSARLPIEFMSSTPTQGEKDQFGNHMRVCLSINKSVCRFTSFNPSEPVVAEGAYSIMTETRDARFDPPVALSEVLKSLQQRRACGDASHHHGPRRRRFLQLR